jgi:hypothetical protein
MSSYSNKQTIIPNPEVISNPSKRVSSSSSNRSRGGSISSQSNSRLQSISNDTSKYSIDYQRFFCVELIDPQLNFLDTKTHSCFLICAGKSSLEGLKQHEVVIATEDKFNQRVKLQLHMEGVSLFTAFTYSNDWSSESDHSVNNQILWRTLASQSKQSADSYSTSANDKEGESSLKIAVNDFEIDAQYDFFTSLNIREGLYYLTIIMFSLFNF